MTKPNWSDWLLTPDVKVWEACVLSIGLEPESMEREDFGWMDDNGTGPYFTSESFPNSEAEKKYKNRLKVLGRNLSDRKYFSAGVIAYGKGAGLCSVRLDEFASWAASKAKWLDLPPELAGLVLDKTNGDSKAAREVLINRDKQASPTKATLQDNPSRDTNLTREIEVAISKTTEPDSDISVWTSLRNMALEGEGLFTGLVDEKGLHYVKSAGNGAAIFTKQALSKRLKRRRERGATKSH